MNIHLEIHATNELNRIAKAETDNIKKQLIPYMGKQIKIATGFSKKFKIDYLGLTPLGFDGRWSQLSSVHLSSDYSSLWLKISICLSVSDTTCSYWKKDVFIGNCDKFGVLQSIDSREPDSERFPIVTFAEVEKEIIDYQAAIKIVDSIRSNFKVNADLLRYYNPMPKK